MRSKFERKLRSDWKLESEQKLGSGISGKELASIGFNDTKWLNAKLPSTVLTNLVENGLYPKPYKGKNLEKIPVEQFRSPWWFRREFELKNSLSWNTILLDIKGINYRADIWLNGKLIAPADKIRGSFRMFRLNITGNLRKGNNVLAIRVFPPEPGDYSIGFVDWNVDAPDQNMGIFRDISLYFSRGITIEKPVIETELHSNRAYLSAKTELVNYSTEKLEGKVYFRLGDVERCRQISLDPGERKTVSIGHKDYPNLFIENPRLWWPQQLGEPFLYQSRIWFEFPDGKSDCIDTFTGIRKVESYINPRGNRGFKINGKELLIKGAGWTDELMLRDTPGSIKDQLAYAAHIGLNTIRLEGFWGKDESLYELCDSLGIMIMAGWSCQWEHEEWLGKPVDERYGGAVDKEDIDLLSASWKDQLLWLRNHASIFLWNVGSDKVPHPNLEAAYIETFNKYDSSRPWVNSTGGVGSEQGIVTDSEIISDISGSSGMKMLGPYAYTPPVYWYADKKLGGAYGFNTETCPGAAVPPLESIKAMIPADKLWPPNDHWEFHCGKNEFSTLERFSAAIDKRYGGANSPEEYARKAQIMNYELMRPMFEAFRLNFPASTGIIQWKLNSALPNMYWQLYDAYLRPTGGFYGAKKANRPLQLIYNYGDKSVYFIKEGISEEKEKGLQELQALVRVFDINSKELFSREVKIVTSPLPSKKLLKLPAIKDTGKTYFLDLRLRDRENREIENNFYWISETEDILDYNAEFSDWPFYTPSREYADMSLLDSIPSPLLSLEHNSHNEGDNVIFTVNISNTGKRIAFFIELGLMNMENGELILPVLWDDNYFSLLPGESRIIKASLSRDKLSSSKVLIKVVNGI